MVRCYKIVNIPEVAFVMEYCVLGNLNNFFVARNPGKKIRRLFLRHIAAGVAHLHENNLTHRDLKPDNIFITGSPAKPIAKIGDYGLAKFASNTFQGSLYEFYMSTLAGRLVLMIIFLNGSQLAKLKKSISLMLLPCNLYGRSSWSKK